MIFIVMEYIPLTGLRNTYPSPSSYVEGPGVNTITLKGIFDGNSYPFTLIPFDELTVVSGTSFRFIIALYNNSVDAKLIDFITSDSFYNDIVKSKESNNPYFLNTALDPRLHVNIYLDSLNRTYREQIELEREIGVKMELNLFYDSEGLPNYESLAKYIDWVVSKPSLEEVDTDGVLPHKSLSRYELGDFNTETFEWGTVSEVSFQQEVSQKERELEKVRDDIQKIESYLRNPKKATQQEKALVAGLVGAGVISLVQGFTTAAIGAAASAALTAATTAARTAAAAAFGGGSALAATTAAVNASAASTVATSLLGGPVGIAIGVAALVVGFFTSKKKKKEREERARKLNEYMEKLSSELSILKVREIELEKELEDLKNRATVQQSGTEPKIETNKEVETSTIKDTVNETMGNFKPFNEAGTFQFQTRRFNGKTFVWNGTRWAESNPKELRPSDFYNTNEGIQRV